MITHDELSKALYEAWCKKLVYGTAAEFEDWDELGATYKAAWSAVADAAWEHVEGENAEYARQAADKLDDLRGAVVEFMNRVEDIIA
jgi:hypothetical protein